MLTSYLIACPTYSGDKADVVKAFLKYVVSTDGQQKAADNAGSAPLPSKLQQQAEAIIATIAAK
jgi:phosphate transport system substrate-binding protein